MLPAVYDTVAADIEAAGDCLFRAQGSTLKFAGFTAVYVETREESEQPRRRTRRAPCRRSWRARC